MLSILSTEARTISAQTVNAIHMDLTFTGYRIKMTDTTKSSSCNAYKVPCQVVNSHDIARTAYGRGKTLARMAKRYGPIRWRKLSKVVCTSPISSTLAKYASTSADSSGPGQDESRSSDERWFHQTMWP